MRIAPFIVFLLPLFADPVRGEPATARPNVLLICVDDLKPVPGCYGGTAKTPNVDRLATRGVLFERAFCNQAVCSPSRNALMTGIRPGTLGIYDLGTNFRDVRPDTVTLSQAFRRAGYRAESMGKIFHVGHGNHEDPASWETPNWRPAARDYAIDANRTAGLSREEALFQNRPASETSVMRRGAPVENADVPDNAYPDGLIAEEAVRRLRLAKENPDKPFFIAVGFIKPHLPFNAPKKYWDLYDRASFELPALRKAPEGAPEWAPQSSGELRQYADIPAQGPVSDDMARTLIHGYHAATSFMDAQLGRVLSALDETGLASNTIIVFWGDHGWHLGDHGMWCKHTNYEQAARIPLIIAAPGAKAGVKSASLIESVDLYPTLCELAGVTAPSGLEGRSAAAVLRDPAAATKDHILHFYPRGERIGRAVRTERYRLVEWKRPGEPETEAVFELYDYQIDPAETTNLAAAQPEVVKQLRAMLATHPEAKPQWKRPGSAAGNAKKPAEDREAMFARRDTDKDGKLTREEFLLNQPDPDKAPARFTLFDADRDGQLSREEFVRKGEVKR